VLEITVPPSKQAEQKRREIEIRGESAQPKAKAKSA